MNFEEYMKQRNELMASIEGLIAEGKTEDANAKMKEVEELDNKWDDIKLANANLNALKDNTEVLDLENQSENIEGSVEIMDELKDNKNIMDNNKIYESAWANYMQGKALEGEELGVFNEVNKDFNNAYTHTTANTSVLIPETVAEGIWARAEEMYPFLSDAKKYNVKGKFTILRHDSIAAGDATWYTEGNATADEENVFGELNLTGCELAKAITVSWKLRAMAIEEFIPYIQREVGTRIGVTLGRAVFAGSGVAGTQPAGVETKLLAEALTPQVITYNPAANPAAPLTYSQVAEAVGKLHSSYLPYAAFYANNATIWNTLATVKDSQGKPIFIPDASAGGVGRIFGIPVHADAGVSADSIVLGAPSEAYVINTSEPMSIASEEHVKARTVDYAAYTVVDGAPLDLKAFVLIKKSS